MALVPKKLAFLPALPFYFMELLVGFIQALVFMLLCAVFLNYLRPRRRRAPLNTFRADHGMTVGAAEQTHNQHTTIIPCMT